MGAMPLWPRCCLSLFPWSALVFFLPWAAEPIPGALRAAVHTSAWDPVFPSGIAGNSPHPCAVYCFGADGWVSGVVLLLRHW